MATPFLCICRTVSTAKMHVTSIVQITHNPAMDRDWFIRRMNDLGLTQERLSQAIGRDRSATIRILAGERELKLSEISKWAGILDVCPLELVRHAYTWEQ